MADKVGSKGMDKRGLRVLLVEDRAADAELLEYELRRAGFEPHCYRVDTEADYLAHLDLEPDIILADHSLPQFDTFRALELLQERGLDIPLIIVSGTIGEDRGRGHAPGGSRLSTQGPSGAAGTSSGNRTRTTALALGKASC